MSVAQTILAQLGGNRFVAMTGAKNLTSDRNCLIFRLPRQRGFVKDGINAVRVTLEPSDTYTMTFFRQMGAPTHAVRTVREYTDVYAEDMRRLFTEATGLDTHL